MQNNVLLQQRVRSIVDELEVRRAAGEPWPPSAERIKEIMGELDARIAAENRELGIV